MIAVTLTNTQTKTASWVGKLRNDESVKDGRVSQLYPSHLTDLQVHILGACGEMAFCKGTGIFWPATVNTFKLPDCGRDWQVKTRMRDRLNDMTLRQRDNPEHRYALVIGDAGLEHFDLIGWIRGKDGRRDEWRSNPGGKGMAWWVPQDKLHRLEDIAA